MISRRSILFALAASSLAFAMPVQAEEVPPFTQQAFEAAQQAGKPILIEVHADWCPTCRAQAPILGKLTDDAKFKDMTVLRVDFDTQKDVCKQFGANSQSTLIVFKGAVEAGRSLGDTNPVSLAALLDKAI